MDSLNTILNSGTYGENVSRHNDNNSKIKQAITTLENVAIANKGYFDTLASLQAAFPSPKAGNIAYVANVASSTGYYIYNVVSGVWTATTTEAPAVDVAISNYAQHGYSSSPKTLKQVEDEIVQLAGNIYQKTQTVIGANAAIISSAFKGLYISGVRDITKKYFLTVVRRNVSGASQIEIYSALATDITQNRTSVARWDSTGGDPNLNKVVKISFGTTTPCIAFIDWSKIPDGVNYTQMFEGYELDDKCFDQNQYDLAASITANTNAIDDMKNSVLYKMEFSLTEGGYIDGRTGGVSKAPNFSYTADFLPVKPGQTIYYKGYNYGNATLCGYSKDKTSFVNLLTTPGGVTLMDIDIIIPDNIYYIRGCTVKVNDSYLLEINPDLNYDFLDKEIIEVIDSKSNTTNMIQDPYFKYGIMLTAVDPQLIAFGGGGVISLSNGEAICKSAITTAKGMQIMARFSQGWATKFGLKAGDTIRVGAYIKAVVGSGSTVTRYGTWNMDGLTADEITYIGTNNSLPLNSYADWQWIERTLTLKTDGTNIDQTTYFSLGYIQLTDPGAATNPTELRIKQPCILFNPPATASGFYESKRSQQMDYLFVNFLSIMGSLSIGGDLSVNNLIFNGSQVESTFLTMTTEKAKIRWIELSDNQCFPSIGKFLGLKNDSDLIFCVNGVETKLN